MNLDDLSSFLRTRKVSFKVNTKYHVAINLPDGSWLDYYPTKSSCMIRGVDDKSSYISDDELIRLIMMGNEPIPLPNSPKLENVRVIKYQKTHPDALPPHKTYITDGGIDLFAVEDSHWQDGGGYFFCVVKTGIALEIPTGHMLVPAPRSSTLFGDHVSPFVSVIDAGYLGEVTFLLFFLGNKPPKTVKRGERAAQVVYIPIPTISCDFEEVDQLPTHHSPRGYAGFGSTGSSGDTISSLPFDV